MKTKEELTALKEEINALNEKLAELTDEELKQVTGGVVPPSSKSFLPITNKHIDSCKPVDKVPAPDADLTKYRPHLDD